MQRIELNTQVWLNNALVVKAIPAKACILCIILLFVLTCTNHWGGHIFYQGVLLFGLLMSALYVAVRYSYACSKNIPREYWSGFFRDLYIIVIASILLGLYARNMIPNSKAELEVYLAFEGGGWCTHTVGIASAVGAVWFFPRYLIQTSLMFAIYVQLVVVKYIQVMFYQVIEVNTVIISVLFLLFFFTLGFIVLTITAVGIAVVFQSISQNQEKST